MGKLEHSVYVARDPQEVWSAVGNFDRDKEWRSVEIMHSNPPGPARVGTATHEVLKFMGSTYVTDATVIEVEPGQHLAYEGGGEGTTVRGYRRVTKAANGTRFTEGIEIELSGMMRLLDPLLSRLYAHRISSETQALKTLLEHGEA